MLELHSWNAQPSMIDAELTDIAESLTPSGKRVNYGPFLDRLSMDSGPFLALRGIVAGVRADSEKRKWSTMATDEVAHAVEAATNELLAATVSGDTETYSQLAADDLEYIHSNSERDSKSSIMEKVGAGQYKAVAKIIYAPSDIWVIGEVAVAVGTMTPVLHEEGKFPARPVSSVDVWRQLDGRWQLLVHHLTAIPQPA